MEFVEYLGKLNWKTEVKFWLWEIVLNMLEITDYNQESQIVFAFI